MVARTLVFPRTLVIARTLVVPRTLVVGWYEHTRGKDEPLPLRSPVPLGTLLTT